MKDNRRAWINAAKSWQELAKQFKAHGRELGVLIIHPEATDAMILEAVHYRRDIAQKIEASREKLVANYHANMSSYNQGHQLCWNLLTAMQDTTLN